MSGTCNCPGDDELDSPMPESPNLEGFDQPQSTPEGNLDEEESFSSQTNSGHTCNCPEDDELDSPVPESPSLEGFSQLQLSDEEYLVEGESYESLRARAIRILERLPPSASEIASVLWACMLLADIGRLAEMNNNPLEPYGFDELDEACETLGMAILDACRSMAPTSEALLNPDNIMP